MDSRYLIIVLGSYTKIEKDLNEIANSEHGVNYVDGNGIFMGTFYSPYNVNDLHDLLLHIPAFLIFDITDKRFSTINLPSKYFKGLFPEYEETLDVLQKDLKPNLRKVEKESVEEYDNVDDILDKLSRNEYDRSCLTDKEIEILEKGL
jgi:hypothetical protein